ncbi:MAG: hypothetical protein JW871_02490 [Endomicrobiales bacterium]|nr:hypothetical protein [Endomicrobiales bacterium]
MKNITTKLQSKVEILNSKIATRQAEIKRLEAQKKAVVKAIRLLDSDPVSEDKPVQE